jgi:hypothetical protein
MIAFLSAYRTPAFAQSNYTAKVTIPPQHFTAPVSPVVTFNGIINTDRVLLNWTLDKNQMVDQIQIESSADEKTFIMAGLVFGTDQPDKAEYLFYEKNKKKKSFYRLKIINKDQSITYSSTIVPASSHAKQ